MENVSPIVTVLGFFCVGPFIMIGFGFWLGRFTKGLRITHINPDNTNMIRHDQAAPPAGNAQNRIVRKIAK